MRAQIRTINLEFWFLSSFQFSEPFLLRHLAVRVKQSHRLCSSFIHSYRQKDFFKKALLLELEKEDSAVRRTCDFCRGSGFSIKHPPDSSQPSLTQVLGDSSSELHELQACAQYI